MRKNKILLFMCFLVTISVVGFYFTPYLSVYNMKKAAEKQNADALSRYVDYPALRESLKANFNAMMASEITQSDNPFGALGTALGAALVNQMIDAFITPESLAMMIKGEEPQIGDSGKEHKEKSSPETEAETSMSYEGINQFVVKVKDKNSSEDPIKFIYKRAGIISWKLSALRLPSFKEGKTVTTVSSKSTKLDPASKKAKSEEIKKPLLVPTLTNKRFQGSDWQSGVYEEAIWFDISWDTDSLPKPTRAIKGTLIISDLFGESKLRLKWTINQPLTPGTSYTEKGVGFEYNQFTDSHKWVRATDLKDMTFKFEITDIIYQDGTQETF